MFKVYRGIKERDIEKNHIVCYNRLIEKYEHL